MAPPALYALLVGIDQYDPKSGVRSLRGCVNDVDAMEQLLAGRFGVPAANIRKLTNKAAKYKPVKDAFRQQLIGNARKWKEAGSQGEAPAFLFHYSGHGSQARDETGTEPDGLDETLVTYNSRTPGVYDLKDWELGQLIEELNQYSQNVTIILDCCHSGSGTRDASENVAQTRRAPPDLRPQPKRRPVALRTGQTRSVSGANWEVAGTYVLLAGCRDLEESNEYGVKEAASIYWRGAMSYFIDRELVQMSSDRVPTYRELHERVRAQVNSLYKNQVPQCEGDIDRELFGGLRPQRDLFYTVVEQNSGLNWIDGGVAHGITEGSQLKAYPAQTRTLTDAGPAIATLEVVEEEAVRSGCRVIEGAAQIPLHARVVVHRLNHGDMRRKVLLDLGNAQRRQLIADRLASQGQAGKEDYSAYLEVVTSGAADFRVTERNQQLEIQDAASTLLVAPFALGDLDGLAADLAHLARFRNGLNLRNAAPHSELAGQVSLAVKKLAFDPATQQPLALDFPRSAEGGAVIETEELVVFEITNKSPLPLYVALFDYGPRWEVMQLYPNVRGAHEPVQAGTTFQFGLSASRREQIQAFLPDGISEAKETFKLIATVADADFELLQQGPLKTPLETRAVSRAGGPLSALDALLLQAANGGRSRAFGPPPATVADEWTTTELVVTTVRKANEETRDLRGGQPTQLPSHAIEFVPPPGFDGKVRVLTATQSTRSAGGDASDLEPPPGLAANPDWFAPLPIGGTRSATTTGALIEIEADDPARQAVTPATPLEIQMAWEADEGTAGVLAVAYDGSFFYPVGRGEAAQQTIHVEWLPPTAPGDEQPVRTTRSVGRTLKLYLYKLLKRDDLSLGLHRVHFVPAERIATEQRPDDEQARAVPTGELRYSPLRKADIQANARIALVVHGFSSITTPMADWVINHLPQLGVTYDHVLAFDYESFNTAISDNGQTLANLLRAAGFAGNDGWTLDVISHSMGTLVTRSMVELWGGDAFIDRCFLAGPPNEGTRLADVKKLVPWLSTLLLNGQWGTVPPAALAGWVLNRAADDAVGPEDLRPSSSLIHALNLSTKPATTPYFIVAGRNQKPANLKASAWERLKHKVFQGMDAALDLIFGDQNDMVINVQSMVTVRSGHYPARLLKTAEVPCNHFEYFATKESQTKLVEWIKSA
jgi:hypothetical protein